jgi:type VI secretion system secreted protein VgrG
MRSVVLSLESTDDLEVRHFSIVESMSAAFQIHVIARGRDDLHLSRLAGKESSFLLQTNRGERKWTGVCSEISLSDHEAHGVASYSVTLAPRLWLLTHRRNHRVFQHLSVPQIALRLLHAWHIEPVLKLSAKHPKLEFRVQYGESDYDFLRRLLVEAGISFYFEPTTQGVSRVVLSDHPEKNAPHHEKPIPYVREHGLADGQEHVAHVSLTSKVHATRATFGDHDFRRPRYALAGAHAHERKHPEAHDAMLEEYHYAPGHSHAEADGGGTPLADSQGAYRHLDKEAKARAERRVDALRSAATKVGFQTTLRDLSPGTVFELDGHPHPDLALGKRLLVTESWINGDVKGSWTSGGHAVPAEHTYRPLLTRGPQDPANCSDGGDPYSPINTVNKPRIHGVQTALVVGPPGEEIYTDEHGRVRVQFPWDREGKHDEKSSCWVRVSQAAAGAGFGSLHLPRVGQEVLVSFLDGDPDHPVIVGRLHNATAPEPYPLPEHKTRSSWKSHSHSGHGNEITFEDKKHAELFYVQAEKDLHKLVKENELEHTLGDRHIAVDGDFIIHAAGKIVLFAGEEVVVKGGPHVHLNPPKDPKKPVKPLELSTGKHKGNPRSAASANSMLFKMHPGARPDSIKTAAARKHLAQKYKPLAEKLGKKYHRPPALILAWMSRESGLGEFLRKDGYSKFDGFGYGLLQVDRRYHHPHGDPFGEPSCDQAIGDVFASMLAGVKNQHPDWTHEEQIAGALVDYNSGPNNAQTKPSGPGGWAAMDSGTADDNYSRDVWAQAQWYAEHLDW